MYLTFVQEGLLLLLVYCCCVTTPRLVFSLAHCVVNSVLVHVEHCSHALCMFTCCLLFCRGFAPAEMPGDAIHVLADV